MNKNLTKTKIEKCKHTWERKLSLNYLGYLFFIHVYNEILSCAFPTSMIIKKLLHKSISPNMVTHAMYKYKYDLP